MNDHIEMIAQVEHMLEYIAQLPAQERRIINYDAQIETLETEIRRYQDLKVNLYSDMADGVISREEYREFHAGYDRRIAERQRQLGKLKEERDQAMEHSSGNIEWIEQFKKYQHLTELDRECIVHLIEKILIYEGKRIEVCFRYRDELESTLQYPSLYPVQDFPDIVEEKMQADIKRNIDYILNKILSNGLGQHSFYFYVLPFNDAETEKKAIMEAVLKGDVDL